MATTFLTIQNQVYEELRANPSDKESNRIYPISLVKQSINDAQKRTLNRRNYPFLIVTKVFNSIVDTTLSADLLSGATTVYVTDASGFNSAGKAVIKENVFTYTGKTATTLTGVTGITADFTSGAKVKQLYNLSTNLIITNLKKPISVVIDEIEYEYYDYRGKTNNNGFTIFDGNLYLPDMTEVKPVIFKYKIEIETLVDDSDEFLIPDDYVTLTKEYTLYKCHRNVDDDRYVIAFQEFNRLVKELENDYGKQTENKNIRIKSIYEND